MKLSNNLTLWGGAIFVFLFDQLTKLLSLNSLHFDQELILNQSISFHLIYNADNIMGDYSLPFGLNVTEFRIIWVIFALLLALGISWVINQKSIKHGGWEAEFSKVGLFLILGSIWGNAFDRIFRPEGVIDFIRLNFIKDTIPIVNIADIMLYVGEISLIIGWSVVILNYILKFYKPAITK
jgi:signal peptidase II